ncbi:uncharacterized protein BX663DRAFT_502253, partial [Cokeromyces recurvatus]|uniref:uncharacterized protein n=1 Tax=Cokeromyces recurvatus TaxID=90255 RepID=UPI00221FEFDD
MILLHKIYYYNLIKRYTNYYMISSTSTSTNTNTNTGATPSITSNQAIHSPTLSYLTFKESHPSRDKSTKETRSATKLLRKSSIYLKNKFYHHTKQRHKSLFNSLTLRNRKKKRQKNSSVPITHNLQELENKNRLLYQQEGKFILQQPPIIITQYPPKPLKYSPVEFILPETTTTTVNDKKRRRLSLPLLKLSSTNLIQRQKSESNILIIHSTAEEPVQQRLLQENSFITQLHCSLNKQWNKLISNMTKPQSKKKKKGKSPLLYT